jgi:hypothetical protein
VQEPERLQPEGADGDDGVEGQPGRGDRPSQQREVVGVGEREFQIGRLRAQLIGGQRLLLGQAKSPLKGLQYNCRKRSKTNQNVPARFP